MIRVTVLYPTEGGTTFDHDYYAATHVPLVREALGSALVRSEYDRGFDGQPFHAAAHLFFDSMESLGGAMGAAGEKLSSDIPNYTNATPVMQISEVLE